MVRAGDGGQLVSDFQLHSCVAIGWHQVGDLTALVSLADMRSAVAAAFPDAKPGTVIITGSTLHKFRSAMAVGDRVVTYDPGSREYLLGEIIGDYQYAPNVIPQNPNVRATNWLGRISRDALSPGSKNTLGSAVTIFEPGNELLEELLSRLGAFDKGTAAPETSEEPLEEFDLARQDSAGRAHELLKDRLLRLSPDEMEALVAALLRAMGYKASVTPKGPDRGRDVIASPDGLGFQKPRIFAEVKHRREPIGAQPIRSFLGGLRDGDCGLYVSTGGFTKDARYEADRAQIPTTLVDLDRLAELVVEHYDRLDQEGRVLVPLVRVYWPTS